MKHNKKRLLSIARLVEQKIPLTPPDTEYLLGFERKIEQKGVIVFLRQLAVPFSLAFGFFYTVFPQQFNAMVASLPSWTNLTPELLTGIDYLWDLLGEPVRKANILYHFPNIILYSFGFFGLKKLFEALDKRTWLDRVINAQFTLRNQIKEGVLPWQLKKGHSILFVGKSDFIGTQFVLNHKPDNAVTIAESSLVWLL